MNLTQEQVRLALYAVRDLVTRRTLGGQPIPNGFHAFLEQLTASAHGSESDTPAGQLVDAELIDSTGAATILNCSPRWVRQIHSDLDGRKFNGRYIFDLQTVIAYAEERHAS